MSLLAAATNLQVEEQTDMHNGTMYGGGVDQRQTPQHHLPRLQHLIEQVLGLVSIQHQIRERQAAESCRHVAQKTLQLGEQLTPGAKKFNTVRVVGSGHIARKQVVESRYPRTHFFDFWCGIWSSALLVGDAFENEREKEWEQLTSH